MTERLVAGDPQNEETFIGPMITEKGGDSAALAGGVVLCGGKCDGAILEAKLLENVPSGQDVCTHEVFGPVAVLSSFSDFDAALAEVNDSVFGLQAGIFTRDLYKMQQAWDTLDVGGVVISDAPS